MGIVQKKQAVPESSNAHQVIEKKCPTKYYRNENTVA
jgi:hypothetical protein